MHATLPLLHDWVQRRFDGVRRFKVNYSMIPWVTFTIRRWRASARQKPRRRRYALKDIDRAADLVIFRRISLASPE